MLFIVRGKNKDADRVLRVHAETQEEAEQIGWKRGLFVTEVTPLPAGSAGVSKIDRVAEALWKVWRATPKSRSAFRAFGRPVSNGQAAALVLLGCMTWLLDLRMIGVVTF